MLMCVFACRYSDVSVSSPPAHTTDQAIIQPPNHPNHPNNPNNRNESITITQAAALLNQPRPNSPTDRPNDPLNLLTPALRPSLSLSDPSTPSSSSRLDEEKKDYRSGHRNTAGVSVKGSGGVGSGVSPSPLNERVRR